jgi:hypothetical protein
MDSKIDLPSAYEIVILTMYSVNGGLIYLKLYFLELIVLTIELCIILFQVISEKMVDSLIKCPTEPYSINKIIVKNDIFQLKFYTGVHIALPNTECTQKLFPPHPTPTPTISKCKTLNLGFLFRPSTHPLQGTCR